MKFLNAIGRSLLTILVMLLIGYGWAFFEMKIMLKSYPELFGLVFYQQTTDEMEPDFSVDDVVIVKKDEAFSVGDRIMFMNSDNNYTIRTVTYTDKDTTITKCAACQNDDEKPVNTSDVTGKAIGKILLLGKFINFFKQKWFLISLACVGFILVVVSQHISESPKKVETNK